MPSTAISSMAIENHRTSFSSVVALFAAVAITASCQVGFGEAHTGEGNSALADGQRAVWVLEAGTPQSQVAESLLDVGGTKQKRSQNSVSPKDDQDPKANSMGMWFGPRLGRRRRSIAQSDLNGAETSSGNNQSPSTSNDFNEDLALASLFREGPWSLRDLPQTGWFSIPSDRSDSMEDRRMVNFTPRLGRESGEENLSAPPPPPPPPPRMQLATALRSPPFAPRLGRGLLFSPRMGRSAAHASSRP